jgi:S-adenosylmethionine:diacylglycerol 3-amino-3-carboxypropyl transferase
MGNLCARKAAGVAYAMSWEDAEDQVENVNAAMKQRIMVALAVGGRNMQPGVLPSRVVLHLC